MPTFQPFAAGAKVTAATLDLNLMIGLVVFRAYLNTNQSIPTGTEAAANACAWSQIDLDLLAGFSAGAPTLWTVPIDGWWTLSGGVGFNGNAGGSQRDALWFIDGATIVAGRARTFAETGIAATPLSVEARTIPLLLSAGQTVALVPAHNVGSALLTATGTFASYMSVTYSGPA